MSGSVAKETGSLKRREKGDYKEEKKPCLSKNGMAPPFVGP